jgi:hypothetical protein
LTDDDTSVGATLAEALSEGASDSVHSRPIERILTGNTADSIGPKKLPL